MTKLIFLNKKRHILFINSWYPSKVMPTNGDFIQRHAEAVALKNNVTAIHIVSDKNARDTIEVSDEIINEVRTIIGYVKFTKNPLLKWWRFIAAFKKIYTKIPHFDVVHLNRIYPLGLFALYLKYKVKKPYIVSEHWTDFKYPLSKKIGFIEKQCSKVIAKNASFLSPVTHDLKSAMQLFGLKGMYKPVPNVVDTSLFSPEKKIDDTFTLIHISNMIDAYKNVTGILDVFKRVHTKYPAVKLKLIGNNVTQYRNTIKRLNLDSTNCELIEHIPQHELATHLKMSNLFLLFSNHENLPCVILEAFSCGIPVISTDVGGIKEFFPEHFGALIAPNDKEQLFNEISKFYTHAHNSVSKDEMHNYVLQNFSEEKICDEFSQLYDNSLEN